MNSTHIYWKSTNILEINWLSPYVIKCKPFACKKSSHILFKNSFIGNVINLGKSKNGLI